MFLFLKELGHVLLVLFFLSFHSCTNFCDFSSVINFFSSLLLSIFELLNENGVEVNQDGGGNQELIIQPPAKINVNGDFTSPKKKGCAC